APAAPGIGRYQRRRWRQRQRQGPRRRAAHRQVPGHLQERRRRHDPHPLRLRQPPLLHHRRPVPLPRPLLLRGAARDLHLLRGRLRRRRAAHPALGRHPRGPRLRGPRGGHRAVPHRRRRRRRAPRARRRGRRPRRRRRPARHGPPRGGAPPPHGPPRRAARPHGPLLLSPPPLARILRRPRLRRRHAAQRRRHAGDLARRAPGEPVRRPRVRPRAPRGRRRPAGHRRPDGACGVRARAGRRLLQHPARPARRIPLRAGRRAPQHRRGAARRVEAAQRQDEEVLAVSDELREECFVESTKGCIMQILNFGDAVAVCPRSPEKLSRILDMYEALAEVIPEMKDLCLGSSGDGVISDVQAILDRLGEAVRGTLFEFGKVLQQESSRRAMTAGEIHPMTRYVMNYLRLLVVYSETLDGLLDDDGDESNALERPEDKDQDTEHLEGMTPLGRRLLKLMCYLEANLEDKSKLYEDAALECIFSMNNLLYIVQKVKDSELGKILGDHWVRRRSGKIRQYSKSYLRISWMKTLSYLRDDVHGSGGGSGSGSGSGHSGSRMSIKEKFKNFNLSFEEIYRNQTLWKVPDPQLREELKISISENVIPAYRAFLGRYGSQVDGGKNSGKYIKYTPEDLESQLSDLFEGSPGSANHSRRRT
uniref:Exocyst subunit Exo70 family protein n=1 Tax=Aegilops tauschii subsp. strangulata TaxID=200361 RepID=A0A453QVH6_AEGTS